MLIDGALRYSGSAYNTSLLNNQVLAQISGLPDAGHTVRVVKRGGGAFYEDKMKYTNTVTGSAYSPGESVDDDDTGAYNYVGAWQRSLNATYVNGALHFLTPGADSTATLAKPIACNTVRFASRGGNSDKYDIMLDG